MFLLLTTVIATQLQAQVGGVSNSKIVTLNCATVEQSKLEFEPAFFVVKYSKFYNNNKLTNYFSTSDSVFTSAGMGFRFTYGLGSKTEIGVSIPSDISDIAVGLKYHVLSKGKYDAALIAGYNYNVPFGRSDKILHRYSSYVVGIINSFQISDKLSVDTDIQIHGSQYLKGTPFDYNYFFNTDAGYYLTSGLQLCAGFSYSHQNSSSIIAAQALMFNPGITIETGKNFVLILSVPNTVWGKNTDKVYGFAFALTTTFE